MSALLAPNSAIEVRQLCAPLIDFVVDGKPAPKGSWRFLGRRKVRPDNPRSKPWEAAARYFAAAVIAKSKMLPFALPMRGTAFAMVISFRFVRPKRGKRDWPIVPPDLDKLARAIQDALQGVVWHNDSAVCLSATEKVYAAEPGARVRIWRL